MDISKDIAAFERLLPKLEQEHAGKWILIVDEELVQAFETFEDAASEAVVRFGRGPFLIRQVGAPPPPVAPVLFFMQRHA